MTIKVAKETGSQLYIDIMYQLALTTISSNTSSQMYVQIKHHLAHLQDLIFTWLVYICLYIYISQRIDNMWL